MSEHSPAMKIDILTLFPESVSGVMGESIMGRASARGILEIRCIQIRDFTENRQKQVDDYPYGGGCGCVMMAQPLKSALMSALGGAEERKSRVIYLSPQGAVFDQETAKRLARDYDHLVLVCGHYEGIDERFVEKCVDEEISIGDFVLTGGEIPAMAVADSVCRLVPGVLSSEECYTGESHWEGLLEYAQYTRPEEWEGLKVPPELLTGNHEAIRRFRRLDSIKRTIVRRPDMFQKFSPSKEDLILIETLEKGKSPELCKPTFEPVRATPEDIPDIMRIISESREYIKGLGIDQWQNGYPSEDVFVDDIAREECYIFRSGGETCGVFVLASRREDSYDSISGGQWMWGDSYSVIHRIAVADDFRGSGLATEIIEFAKEMTRGMGRSAIRVDTHRGNMPMQRLLGKCGFEYRGVVYIDNGVEFGIERLAYEFRIV